MAEEIRAARRRLTVARLTRVRALTARQTAAVLRNLQHPDWPIDQVADASVEDCWLPSVDEVSACTIQAPAPSGEVTEWWHRTAQIPAPALETRELGALWVSPILAGLGSDIVRTLSFQIQTVPAGEAKGHARGDVTTDNAEMMRDQRRGRLADLDMATKLSGSRRRLADLTDGSGHHGSAWVGHVTISCRTRDQLAEASERLTEAADSCGIGWLAWHETQQSAALACTLPVARGMAPPPSSAGSRLVRGVLAGGPPKGSL
jgi:hypothetical protein